MNRKPNIAAEVTGLRRRAEARLRERQNRQRLGVGAQRSSADTQRLLQELQVHQVELEMQNAELQEARNRAEVLLEKYTDLYDFAPVGHFSLDEQGQILEVNLTGAALLGVERFRLINRRLLLFVDPASRPAFLSFLEQVFARQGKRVCEARLFKEDGAPFWANFYATSAFSASGPQKWCRVAVSDITAFKQAEVAQCRMEALAATNRELQEEIIRRQAVQEALKRSEQHQIRLLQQSRQMQEQLRHLARQILLAQEEERKRISRELHDEITQTLVGINVDLETLARETLINPRKLRQTISHTQRLVAKSVTIVHRFALELRPTLLDDLGLVPALHSFMKEFTKRTGIHIQFTASAGLEQLDSARRTVLYRVAQSALTNVAQHAQASRVKVSLRKRRDAIRMEIRDEGGGFEVERVLFAKRHKRLGLLGMRERVEMVGGSFAVESAPGQGTTIRAHLPLGNGNGRKARF
jgi:PAS domain S-box-containing protein